MKNLKGQPVQVPKLGKWILHKFSRSVDRESIAGDIEEEFCEMAKHSGGFRARFWFLGQLLMVLFSYLYHSVYWGWVMFKSYWVVLWRNIRKQKGYSFINISGLAIGMTCFLLIFLWIQDEWGYDRFHRDSGRIFRVISEKHHSSQIDTTPRTPPALATELKAKYPAVEEAVRMAEVRGSVGKKGKDVFFRDGYAADPDIFNMFSFKIVEGDTVHPLSNPNAIAISKRMSQVLFGEKDPIGETVSLDNRLPFFVRAVFDNYPANSHLKIDFLVPLEFMKSMNITLNNWRQLYYFTYIKLKEDSSPLQVGASVSDLIREHQPESHIRLVLQPLEKIHLYALNGGGRIVAVVIFMAVGILILGIACFNYMNLMTARYMNRSLEVGVRKVLGASRWNLMKQFFGEAILMSLFSSVIALLLGVALLPVFNDVSGKNLNLGSVSIMHVFLVIGIALLIGILSGSYPALLLSSLRPKKTLRGTAGTGTGGSPFRKVLVVVQFSFTVFFIIGALTISKQLKYLKNKDLGFDRENLIYVQMESSDREKQETLRRTLLQAPAVKDITFTNTEFLYLGFETAEITWEDQKAGESVNIQIRTADFHSLKTFGMEMAAGRFFSPDVGTDIGGAFILNETAVNAMGMQSPVGKRFSLGDSGGVIIGVVKDFHFHSMRDKIEPMVFLINPRWNRYLFLRVMPGKIPDAIGVLEKNWDRIHPGSPFRFFFLDERINGLYRSERQMGKVIGYFTLIAVIISCMGLFGMASFMLERRVKEIGIRKVLGSSVPGIVGLFSREIIRWVVISNIVAFPAAYLFLKGWLSHFAYRIPIDGGIFLLAGVLSLVIALGTVSYQTIRASVTNPVEAIRYE